MRPKSIRTFIGAKDFDLCRQFYSDIGFEEVPLGDMSLFRLGAFGFYLQRAYVRDWVDNSMIFLEVENLEQSLEELRALNLQVRYPGVRLSEIVSSDWGDEFFLHDPSGVLWHIGRFY